MPTVREVMSDAVIILPASGAVPEYHDALAVVLDPSMRPKTVIGPDGPQEALTVSPDAPADDLWSTVNGAAVIAGRAYCLVVVADGRVLGIVTPEILDALLGTDPLERDLALAGDTPPTDRRDGDSRHVNLCFTWPHSRNVLPSNTALQAGRDYELRLDIGERSDDSIVVNPEEFPAHLLPSTDQGTWLDIIVVSDDVELPRSSFPVFLPLHGPGWTCPCPAGQRHTCHEQQRGRYLYIPFSVPAEPGIARLRLTVCVDNRQVQSTLVTAEITSVERPGMTQNAVIDYTLTASLSDVDAWPSPLLSIGVSPVAPERQSMLVRADKARPLVVGITELQMNAMLAQGRDLLTQIQDDLDGRRLTTDPRRFRQNLKKLAIFGRGLFTKVIPDRAMRAELRNRLRQRGVIQVARIGVGGHSIPWGLLYDIPIQDGDPARIRFCPVIEAWDKLFRADGTFAPACPFDASHTDDTVCPFGFWGFRHIIETPPSMPAGHGLPTRIRTPREPKMIVGYGKLPQVQGHLDALRAELAGISLEAHDQRAGLINALHTMDLSLVYFFCHCRRSDGNRVLSPDPYLEISDGRISPNDLAGDDLVALSYWRKNSPLVFINGCQTVGGTLDSWTEFVDAFAQMYASGVIGTEIAIRETLARKAAEHIWRSLNQRSTVGEALHSLRMHFLRDNNLLGLAYSAYCSAHLRMDA
jgi:hypothetical protein